MEGTLHFADTTGGEMSSFGSAFLVSRPRHLINTHIF